MSNGEDFWEFVSGKLAGKIDLYVSKPLSTNPHHTSPLFERDTISTILIFEDVIIAEEFS